MPNDAAYRLGDGAPVTFEAARAIWTAVAREVLEAAPSTRPLTNSELAREVQQRSGVYTRSPAGDWLPGVLGGVGDADLIARVRPDAAPAAKRASSATPRRERVAPVARKPEVAPPAICPRCFMQLPSTGRCDNCA